MKTKKLYLYIISNPAFPAWLKIGRTFDLKARINQYQTYDPERSYKIEYSIEIFNCFIYEDHFSKVSKCEWTQLSLNECIKQITELKIKDTIKKPHRSFLENKKVEISNSKNSVIAEIVNKWNSTNLEMDV